LSGAGDPDDPSCPYDGAMTDPLIDAARSVLAEGLEELRLAVEGLSSEALNRRPAGEGTNSLAVIVAHALASTRSWLSLATGSPPPPRDRPAEFRTVADEGFSAEAAAAIEDCRALLDGRVSFEPRVERAPHWRSSGAEEPVTAAWALLHALAHLGEHIGHAHVTRDLLTSGRGESLDPPDR
jgi:uncharacterized damage-inducible protein DinB